VRSDLDAGKDMSEFHKYVKGTSGGPSADILERKLISWFGTATYFSWLCMFI